MDLLTAYNWLVFRSGTGVRCGTHTVTSYIAKMKNDLKKATANLAGSEDTGTIRAAATPTPKATNFRGPKQKNALLTPATDDENDFAAGYGSDGRLPLRTQPLLGSSSQIPRCRTHIGTCLLRRPITQRVLWADANSTECYRLYTPLTR